MQSDEASKPPESRDVPMPSAVLYYLPVNIDDASIEVDNQTVRGFLPIEYGWSWRTAPDMEDAIKLLRAAGCTTVARSHADGRRGIYFETTV